MPIWFVMLVIPFEILSTGSFTLFRLLLNQFFFLHWRFCAGFGGRLLIFQLRVDVSALYYSNICDIVQRYAFPRNIHAKHELSYCLSFASLMLTKCIMLVRYVSNYL